MTNLDHRNKIGSREVVVVVVTGDRDNPQELFRAIFGRHFLHIRKGWELKDCVPMGLPDYFRNHVVRGFQTKSVNGVEFCLIWV